MLRFGVLILLYTMKKISADGGKQIDDYKVKGGGGTDFMCNWNYMKDKDIPSKNLLCLQTAIHGTVGAMMITVILFLLSQ